MSSSSASEELEDAREAWGQGGCYGRRAGGVSGVLGSCRRVVESFSVLLRVVHKITEVLGFRVTGLEWSWIGTPRGTSLRIPQGELRH